MCRVVVVWKSQILSRKVLLPWGFGLTCVASWWFGNLRSYPDSPTPRNFRGKIVSGQRAWWWYDRFWHVRPKPHFVRPYSSQRYTPEIQVGFWISNQNPCWILDFTKSKLDFRFHEIQVGFWISWSPSWILDFEPKSKLNFGFRNLSPKSKLDLGCVPLSGTAELFYHRKLRALPGTSTVINPPSKRE